MKIMTKSLEFIKRYKIFILFFFVFIIFVFYFLLKSPKETAQIQPTPVISLQLLKSFPSTGSTLQLSTTAVGFMFSVPVNKDVLSVQITPKTTFKIVEENEGTIIYIKPEPQWRKDVEYSLKVTNIESKAGQKLNNEINYKFRVKNPIFVEVD